MTKDDLARVQAEWVQPLSLDLFGCTAWTTPPNSKGYLTLVTLGIFERLQVTTDPDHPDYWHALIEAYRSVAWEQDHFWPTLLDAGLLRGRAAGIPLGRAAERNGNSSGVGGTAYMCTVDSDGMGVSLIQSNFHGIGSGLSAGRTGVWLHNRGAGFTLLRGHPNELAPGRRPLHTLSPSIWT